MPLTEDRQWLYERERSGLEQRIKVTQVLYEGQSQYQDIQVVVTEPFGRALVLDGVVQTTEADEFMYHEMLVHPVLTTLTRPERVLIIGGGDGGSLRRVLEHPVQQVVQVELDAQVVEVCRRYLPGISAGAFTSERARVIFGDGIAYVAATSEEFDAIIIDSTDPAGPSLGLFGEEFYRQAAKRLRPDGLLVAQTGSPLYMVPEFLAAYSNMKAAFTHVWPCTGLVPSYPGSWWLFCVAGNGVGPPDAGRNEIAQRLQQRNLSVRYYSPDVHIASFALPPFFARALSEPQQFDASTPERYPVLYPQG